MAPVLAAGLVLLGACTSAEPPPKPTGPEPTAPAPDVRSVRFVPISLDLDAAAAPPPGSVEAARDQVLATLDAYLRVATLEPVAGAPVGDLGPLFTAAAAARLGGQDRAALVDEGLPPVGDPRPSASVGLRGLVGPDGRLAVMAALVDIKVAGQVDRQPLSVVRQGAFVLVDEGGWKIDGYELRVQRDIGPAGVTTDTAMLPGGAAGRGAG